MGWAKKIWHFIWEDNSIWSWLVNVVLAFVLIKFIVYPGLGFLLQTTHPVVAVVSESMEHNANFDEFWDSHGPWYEQMGITKEQFSEFGLRNGFNKGDIMLLMGVEPEHVKPGDVIVFSNSRRDPIIHRVTAVKTKDNTIFFETKGDNNPVPIFAPGELDEHNISSNSLIGKAIFRIPFLGYIKIGFVSVLSAMGLMQF